MKQLGIIDFDTSHVTEFIRRINHLEVAKEQWVEGAKFVVGCPGESTIYPERIAVETALVKKTGLPLVAKPEEMLKYQLDGVFIESNCGAQHLERAKFFLQHKIPLFIDKPFTCSFDEAQKIFELAANAKTPIMSCSSLRFAPEIGPLASDPVAKKKIFGCVSYGPGPEHPKNPGLFHYGIHAVEMLYAVFGAGCEWLTSVSSEHVDTITGRWSDGRIGTVTVSRPKSDYGITTNVNGKITHQKVGTSVIYRELLKSIVKMFETGKSPIPSEETLEIIEFIELARISSANHGLPQHFRKRPLRG